MISVVIPTYNEQIHIKDCIDSLIDQKRIDFEIIVVDDGSNDDTVSILRFLESKSDKVRIFEQKHKGPAEARNLGAQKAKGSILVFVDGDMTFDQMFLYDLTKPISEGKSKGTFTLEEYVSNWDNIWARCWNYNQGISGKKRIDSQFFESSPVFRAILKEEFTKVGGYSSIGYTDDWTLSRKLGYKATVSKGSKCYHKNPDTLKEVFIQARWIGKNEFIIRGFRKYFNLIRFSVFVSIVIGIIKSIQYKEFRLVIFKIVYDFGIWLSIIESFTTKNLYK